MTFLFSILVSFVYIATFLRVWISKNNTAAVGLFVVVMLGIVNVSRYALGLVMPGEDLMRGSWFFWGEVSDEAFLHSSLALIVVLLAICLNDATFRTKSPPPYQRAGAASQNIFLVSWLLLVLGVVASAYRSFLVRDFIADNGYLATFSGSANVPFLINIFIALPHCCFYAVVASRPGKVGFFSYAGIYLLGLVFTLQTGQRTEFMVGLLLVLWSAFYLGHVRGFLKFIPLGIGMVILAILVNNWRLGLPATEIDFLEFLMFFWGQGVSLLISYGFFENRESFYAFEGWLFLNKLVSCDILPYITGNYCVGDVAAQVPGVWWQKLSYILDAETYNEGGGLGGSMVVSFYLLFNSNLLYLNLFVLLFTAFYFMRISYTIVLTTSPSFIKRFFAVFFMHKLIFFARAGLDVFVPHPREILAMSLFVFALSLVNLLAKQQFRVRGY
jgi:hypothetical protein